MRAVNLLPREAVGQRRSLAEQNPAVLLGAGLGVVVTGVLALGFMHESGAVSSARQDLEQAKAELAKTPKPLLVAPKPDPNAQLAGEKSARVGAVTTALGARLAWDRILREFSLVLPDDVWLSNLTLQAPTASAVPTTTSSTPTNLTIVGSTYSQDSVARLLARLALIPELSNVTLQNDTTGSAAVAGASGSTTPGAAAGLVQFTIVAAVNLPPGATSVTAPVVVTPPTTDTTTTGATS